MKIVSDGTKFEADMRRKDANVGQAEMIAIVRRASCHWVAAVAFINTGNSYLDVTTTNSEESARNWVVEQAERHEIPQSEIRFAT